MAMEGPDLKLPHTDQICSMRRASNPRREVTDAANLERKGLGFFLLSSTGRQSFCIAPRSSDYLLVHETFLGRRVRISNIQEVALASP